MEFAVGSICLSDIPKELIKKVTTKNGEVKMFLNISIGQLKEPQKDSEGKIRSTHWVGCAPKKEDRIEGKNYFIGGIKEWTQEVNTPSAEDINNAPSIGVEDDLPF